MSSLRKCVAVLAIAGASAVATAAVSTTFPQAMLAASTPAEYKPAHPMTLWFTSGLEQWEVQNKPDDFFVKKIFLLGNGRMGLTTAANYGHDRFLINDKSNYDAPITDAEPTGSVEGWNYKSLCMLSVTPGESVWFGEGQYLRQLDLKTAVASGLSRKDGKATAREYLVSRPHGVAAIHYTADDGVKLSYSFQNETGGSAAGDDVVSYSGCNTDLSKIGYNVTFKVVQNGGTLTSDGATLTVTGADEITVYIASVTDYDIDSDDFHSGENADALASRALALVSKAAQDGWEKVYADHIAEYSPLFKSVNFELADANSSIATDAAVDSYKEIGADEAYANSSPDTRAIDMLLFGMGRYLTLAGSRGDLALPTNLEGIWSVAGDRWACDYHGNINVQMNYWSAENTNIGTAHLPLIDFVDKMSKRVWKKYAQYLVPDTEGWTLHMGTCPFGTTYTYNGNYVEVAAWYCSHIWQHWLYSQDRDYLADKFDTLYGAALFYFDWLRDVDGDGLLEINNTYSPENSGGTTVAVHAQQLVYNHLCNTRDAALELGKTAEAQRCQQYIDRMYSGIESIAGAQVEWKGTQINSGDHHRHLSHLMSMFPLGQVSPYDADPSAFDAFRQSLIYRGDTDNGENAAWSSAWKLNCYARALDGDAAMRHIALGAPGWLLPDLRIQCSGVFQLDGSGGIPSGMAEMLMQSYTGVIDLLPALPVHSWPGGSVSGLKAVGNYEVAVDWEDGLMTGAVITDCLSSTLRAGTRLRLHRSRIKGGDISGVYINGVAPVKAAEAAAMRADSSVPVFTEEPATGSYLITLPESDTRDVVLSYTPGINTSLGDIAVDPADIPAEYFDLTGRRVSRPSPGGIYILRRGSSVSKVRL